jgi:hypothetical protein
MLRVTPAEDVLFPAEQHAVFASLFERSAERRAPVPGNARA